MNKWVIKEKIKLLAIHLTRLLIRLLYFLPIKTNRIVLFSFGGNQYSCNPRAISEYILDKYPDKYEVIWAFNDVSKYDYLKREKIRVIKYKSFERIILQITAKYCINNSGSFSWIPVRKGQFHINTWHAGGAYKRLQHDKYADHNRRLTAKETTHMISSGDLFTRYNIIEQFNFSGNILNIGMPRNDVFFDSFKMEEKAHYVRKYFDVSEDELLVLYAPTWRYDGVIPVFDHEMIEHALEEKWGKKVRFMFRNHNLSSVRYSNRLDASDYSDMQDLLCAADVLITDYSSSIWDFSFTYRPCFLYVPDVDKYEKEQGFYTDIYEWGFPVCKSDSQFVAEINDYNSVEFEKKMRKHHDAFGSYENGRATAAFCDAILNQF